MQIDKVVRKMGLGFKKVFSLVTDDQNLYVICTGNVGGLPKAFDHLGGGTVTGSLGVGGALGAAAATPIIRKFQEELVAGEKKINEMGAEGALSGHKKNAKVSFGQISNIDFKDKRQPELTLDINAGKMSFIFQVNDPAEVKSFVQDLKQKTGK